MGTLLDLLLLLVIAKEALNFGSDLPFQLWAVFVLAIPIMLGMAHSMRENRSSIVLEPVRTLIGEGLTAVSFILFLVLLTYQGLAAAFWTLVAVMLVPYGIGRAVGMTASALVLIGALVLSVYFLSPLLGIEL